MPKNEFKRKLQSQITKMLQPLVGKSLTTNTVDKIRSAIQDTLQPLSEDPNDPGQPLRVKIVRPRYKHTCEHCYFIGEYRRISEHVKLPGTDTNLMWIYDLYGCPHHRNCARWGARPYDYAAIDHPHPDHYAALSEASRRLRARGSEAI